MSAELDPTKTQHLAHNPPSVMMIRLGGKEYPLENDVRCPVCTSAYREQVEQAIIGGRVYSKISASLPESGKISAQAIKRHSDLHLIEANAHLRQRLEVRALARGLNIESGEQALVDEITLAEAVVQKTYEAVADGSLRPNLTDGLRAAKLLADYAVDDIDNTDDMAEAFVQYMDEAAKTMSPEQFGEFNVRLENNPVLRALIEKAERAQEQQASQ